MLTWFVTYPRTHQRTLDRTARQLLDEGRNAALRCEQFLSIDKHGVASSSSVGESRVSWEAVERVEETERHIFLYVTSTSAHVIPKWAFETRQGAEDFAAAARSYQQPPIYSAKPILRLPQ
jgi:hypothetical protein